MKAPTKLTACAISIAWLTIFAGGSSAEEPGTTLQAFTEEALFRKEVVFDAGDHVREPYLAVATDGTILAVRNDRGHLRRSTDGGESWGEIIEVPIAHSDSNMIVDERTGDLLVLRMWDGSDRLFRSIDHGKTWQEEQITLRPNEVMKWFERTGFKERATKAERGKNGSYYIHANASESGITLEHGEHEGRLLVTATLRPGAEAHPSDRDPVDAIYSCAVYSDDGGETWQVSGLFPDGYTEEAGLVELSDGTIYYNSRSHRGFHDSEYFRELRPEETLRREAWSYDGGERWEDLRVNDVLPDGGGYNRG